MTGEATWQARRVAARPDTYVYQVTRMARRWRVPLAAGAIAVAAFVLALGFGATAVVIVALLLGLGAATWQARRAAIERDRAFALAERNSAVNVFLDTLLTKAARSGPLTAEQLPERSEVLVASELKGNAEQRAFILGLLASCYRQLDDPVRAVSLLDRVARGTERIERPVVARFACQPARESARDAWGAMTRPSP